MITALVPIKDFVLAKTRLAGVLQASERRALAQAMAEDVLQALADSTCVNRVVLVSDDPGAALLAASRQAQCLTQKVLGSTGLNPTLVAAAQRLGPSPGQSLLFVHGDLPALTPAAIDAMWMLHQTNRRPVLAPDRHGLGTNGILLSINAAPALAFGNNSLARHQALYPQAQQCSHPGLQLDVDTPQDLLQLVQLPTTQLGASTAAFLAERELPRRLALMLADPSPEFEVGHP